MSEIDYKYSLDDKYHIEEGRVFLSGTQALVKLPLLQRKIDQNNSNKHCNRSDKNTYAAR